MRNVALLGTRLVLGSYLAVHGAQKLFGTFGGSGLDKAGAGFDRIGLRPGRTMAIMGAMSVAATTHRAKGPLNARGGFELPLTNLAAAATLAAVGPGRYRIGPSLPRPLAVAAAAGGGLLAAGLVARMLTAAPPAPASPAGQEESAGQSSTQAAAPR